MTTRVQIVMSEEERERIRCQAHREGASLSGWIREAALERLATKQQQELPTSPAELRAFFAKCDAREKGVEPEWDEHLATIARSRSAGGSRT